MDGGDGAGRNDEHGRMARAAVIIPHYQDHMRLERCLSALMPQADAAGGVEVVVVDNASPDPVDGLAARFPGVRFLTETAKGAALARNRGVAETRAPRLFFIDSDCVPAADWIATAIEVAPRADLVGGTVTVFDETPPPRSGAEAFETVFAFDFKTYIEKKGFSGSGNLLTTRAVFEDVGGFRAGLSEDMEWCHRATAAGYRLVHEDRLRVAHPTRQDWPALERKWRRMTDEGWGLMRPGAAGRLRWALKALAMPASVVAHVPRVMRHEALSPHDRRAALGTLARLRMRRAGWMLSQAARPRRR